MSAQTKVPQCTDPAAFVGWLRQRNGRWKQVATGGSYAECCDLVDEHIRTAPDIGQHVEVYVGSRGLQPPMARRAGT